MDGGPVGIDVSPTVPALPGPGQGPTLDELSFDLRAAREHFRAMRAATSGPGELTFARQSLFRATEAYVDALTLRRLPIPRQLRDDMRLLQAMRR